MNVRTWASVILLVVVAASALTFYFQNAGPSCHTIFSVRRGPDPHRDVLPLTEDLIERLPDKSGDVFRSAFRDGQAYVHLTGQEREATDEVLRQAGTDAGLSKFASDGKWEGEYYAWFFTPCEG